jgi:DNA polymerase (family 10)
VPRIIALVATTLPRNDDVADRLELLADLLELEGEQGFRVLAYRRAAARIRETGSSIAQLALDEQLQGIGTTIEDKIVQIVEQGEIEALAKRRERIPAEVVSFMRLPGLGPKTARKIWLELGVTTLDQLRDAAEQQRLRTLTGLGPKTEDNVLKALAAAPAAAADAAAGRTLLGTALPAVLEAVAELQAHPASVSVSEAGSARRRRETVRDLDIIATADDPSALIGHFVGLPWVVEVAARGTTKATVVSGAGLRFDLRVVPPECYGNLLQHFTGSKLHNVALREDAVRRGLSISEYGVAVAETGEVLTHHDERSLYDALGYAYIAPELRENAGELEAARNGELPKLVELRDLKGDLHSHSTWSSDGKATIEQMARAAAERGYSYLAVTDHSHYLREGRLEAQDAELDALAARLAPFRLLKGIEVNIRADASLDVPDHVLDGRDWVVASLHSSFQRDPTGRVLAAMDNPHVDCIGHPTARKISRRPGVDLDLARVIERALSTRTALEINSQPDRLDLPDPLARAAAEAGVPIVVSSDAHSVAALSYVELGIGQARRAWLTRKQVLNAGSWAQIEKWRRGRR